jgi:hypothetical protein
MLLLIFAALAHRNDDARVEAHSNKFIFIEFKNTNATQNWHSSAHLRLQMVTTSAKL